MTTDQQSQEAENDTDGVGQFCSLCHEQLPDEALPALIHVQREHFDSDEFRKFVNELVVRNFCAKCGTAFWSDVESLSKTTFGTHPYCKDCRRENPSLKDLLTDHMPARGLLSRGLHRPDLSRGVRDDD